MQRTKTIQIVLSLILLTLAACGPNESKPNTTGGADAGGAAASGLSFSAKEARGCEFVLVDGSAAVSGVTFADGVKGSFKREAPRTAVAVVSTKDAGLPGGAVVVASADLAGVKIESLTCVDATGAAIDGVTAQIK